MFGARRSESELARGTARPGIGRWVLLVWWTCMAGALAGGGARGADVDLGRAVIVTPANLSGPEEKAVGLLVDEVRKRTLVRWDVVHTWPADTVPVIAVGP